MAWTCLACIKHYVSSAVKKLIFDAKLGKKVNCFLLLYILLNDLLLIRRWRLLENLKTTMPTHP
jgi:hypothetical protein